MGAAFFVCIREIMSSLLNFSVICLLLQHNTEFSWHKHS